MKTSGYKTGKQGRVNKQKLKRTQTSLAVRRAVEERVVQLHHAKGQTGKSNFAGYIDEVRITKGVPRYQRPSLWQRFKNWCVKVFSRKTDLGYE